MLLNKEGISGILLYSLHKRTVAYTATFSLGAFYQNTILLMSSCTDIVYRLTSLLGCRILGSFFPHVKFPPFIIYVLCPTSANPSVTAAPASSGWTHTAPEIPPKILCSESTRSNMQLAHYDHIFLNRN